MTKVGVLNQIFRLILIGAFLFSSGTAQTIPTLELGVNYYTQTNYPTSGIPCLDYSLDDYVFKNPVATFDFSKSQSLSKVEEALGVDVSASISFAVFSVDARVSYASEQSQTSYDLNFNYIFQYNAQAVLSVDFSKSGYDLLNAIGKGHYDDGPDDFAKYCGDSFVQQAMAGVSLVVTYNLHFNNQLDKQKFEGSLDASYMAVASISAHLSSSVQSSQTSITVSLKAIQLGGNPERLQGIIGAPSSDGKYSILKCGEAKEGSTTEFDFASCSDAINNIIDYANAQGEYKDTGLSKQILVDGTGHPLNPSAFFYTKPVPVKWGQINADPGEVLPTAELIQMQTDLTHWYRADRDNLYFMQHYINFIKYKGSDVLTLDALDMMRDTLAERMDAYSSVQVMNCFIGSGNNRCEEKYETVKNIREQTLAIDEETLTFFTTAYYGGCDNEKDNWIYPIALDTLLFKDDPNIFATLTLNDDGTLSYIQVKNSGEYVSNSRRLLEDDQGFNNLILAETYECLACLIDWSQIDVPDETSDDKYFGSATLEPLRQGVHDCYEGTMTRRDSTSCMMKWCKLDNPM
jgi:hypothetical protein